MAPLVDSATAIRALTAQAPEDLDHLAEMVREAETALQTAASKLRIAAQEAAEIGAEGIGLYAAYDDVVAVSAALPTVRRLLEAQVDRRFAARRLTARAA